VADDRVLQLREQFSRDGLHEDAVADDPVVQFERWMADAVGAGLIEPTAMVLATVDASGIASARMVLLKGVVDGAFRFYTNLTSAKAVQLAEVPRAAVTFPWHDLQRQVRVTGMVRRLPEAASDEYWASRPRGAQIGAWASHQSAVIADRGELERHLDEIEARFAGGPVPRPAFWGGYAVEPEAIEFWQGRAHRLHDRLRYRRTPDSPPWVLERLSP
jgi:pyridoxamine 5'-phosphate oxidase